MKLNQVVALVKFLALWTKTAAQALDVYVCFSTLTYIVCK